MVFLEEFNRFIQNKLNLPAATVQLYNGRTIVYKGNLIKQANNGQNQIFYYQSTFDLMQQCASQLRLSESTFRYSLLTNEALSTFLLPYYKLDCISNETEQHYAYRIFLQHAHLQNIFHCDPEAFNYILHQAKSDFFNISMSLEFKEKRLDWVLSAYGMLFAGLLKHMNMQCVSVNVEKLSRLIEIPDRSFVKHHLFDIICYTGDYGKRYATADECKFAFIRTVNEMFAMLTYSYVVDVRVNSDELPPRLYSKAKLSVNMTELLFEDNDGKFQTVEYQTLTKVKMIRSKLMAVEMELRDKTVLTITFLADTRQACESCLALLDLNYRCRVNSKMLIEPASPNHFDPFSVSFNELNQSQTSTNLYNIISKSSLPLGLLSEKQAHGILRQLGLKVGWYVFFRCQRIPHLHPLCIVLNSEANGDKKLHRICILNRDGYFYINNEISKKRKGNESPPNEANHRYRSIQELLYSIKIRVCNKKLLIKPEQLVTEEMIVDLRKNMVEFENDLHKLGHMLSPLCLHLVPMSLSRRTLSSVYTGYWEDPQGERKDVRALLYNKIHLDKEQLLNIARISEISRPEFIHENILKCFGFADSFNTIYYVHEYFGDEILNTFHYSYSSEQLYDLGTQLKNALQFLHDKDIVHGFPALNNVYISKSRKHVKLGQIGVLSAMMQGSDVKKTDDASSSNSAFLKSTKFPGLNEFLSGWFSQRRIRMLHEYPEEKLQETWDRYVFGCTLWQLFNKGATPLPEKSDQDILDKLEGKDCSWFNGGAYFRLPDTKTEFLNKLQKIICICVTWGNKDNLERYEFRKVAEAYEKLAEVAHVESVTSADFIFKASNGKLEFDVNRMEAPNGKYTLVEEEDASKRVVLVDSRKSNLLPRTTLPGDRQLGTIRELLCERGKLLQLSDLNGAEGGSFIAPEPGSGEVEATCRRFSLSPRVWVRSYSKSREIPEQDILEEVKHLLKFQHQNIVPLRGCVMLAETILLVTPCYKYCRSLREFLDSGDHSVTDSQREGFAQQICAGMKYLAQNKCVHRALRATHVYLTNYSNVVISNLGLARVNEALYYRQQRALTSDTFLVYPPEVISVLVGGGKVKFNSSCDVWSYGILLWELYSGELAFSSVAMDITGNLDMSLLDTYFREGNTLETDPAWPEHIRSVISKCLKEEEARITFFGIEQMLTVPPE